MIFINCSFIVMLKLYYLLISLFLFFLFTIFAAGSNSSKNIITKSPGCEKSMAFFSASSSSNTILIFEFLNPASKTPF